MSLVWRPERLETVLDLQKSMIRLASAERFAGILKEAMRSERAQAALQARRRLGRVDRAYLRTLPVTTLGGAYAHFLDSHGLDPDSLPTLPDHRDIDYLFAHLYETHDLWHTVTGFETDVTGEAGLQAFYLAQYPAAMSMAVLSALLLHYTIFKISEWDRLMSSIARGWEMGRAVYARREGPIGFDWAAAWTAPLAEVRAQTLG